MSNLTPGQERAKRRMQTDYTKPLRALTDQQQYAERIVLQHQNLTGWHVKDGQDGYCWRSKKIIQRIPDDFALFLHEVAHALCLPVEHGTEHHGTWAGHYTDLVRKYMVIR